MDTILESISGLLPHDELEEFLRSAVRTVGGRWDADQIVAEVVPMARRHVDADLVRVVVAVYPERRLLVRLEDERRHVTVQEWEYVVTLP